VGRNFFSILRKNNAFLCKLFICFKMHPVNWGSGCPHSVLLNLSLVIVVVVIAIV